MAENNIHEKQLRAYIASLSAPKETSEEQNTDAPKTRIFNYNSKDLNCGVTVERTDAIQDTTPKEPLQPIKNNNIYNAKNRKGSECERYIGDVSLEDILKFSNIDIKGSGKIIYERLSALPQETIDQLKPNDIRKLLKDNKDFESVANSFEYVYGIQIRNDAEQKQVIAERKRQWGKDYREKEVALQMLSNEYDNAIALLKNYRDNQGLLNVGCWRENWSDIPRVITNVLGFKPEDRSFHYNITDIIDGIQAIKQKNIAMLEKSVHQNSSEFATKFQIVTGKNFSPTNINKFEEAIKNDDTDAIQKLTKECFSISNLDNYVNGTLSVQGSDAAGDVAVMLLGAEFMGAGVMANFGKGFARIAAVKGGKIIVPMLAGGTSLGAWTAFQGSVNAVTKSAPTTTEDLKNVGKASLESFGFGVFGGFLQGVAIAPLIKAIDKPTKQVVQSVATKLELNGEMSMADVVKTTMKVASQDPSFIAKAAGFVTEISGFTVYEVVEDIAKDLCTDNGNLPEDMTLEDVTKYVGEKFAGQLNNLGGIKFMSKMFMMMKGGRIGQQAVINSTLNNANELNNIKVKPLTIDGQKKFEITTPDNKKMVVETVDDIVKSSQFLLQLQFIKNAKAETEALPADGLRNRVNQKINEIDIRLQKIDQKYRDAAADRIDMSAPPELFDIIDATPEEIAKFVQEHTKPVEYVNMDKIIIRNDIVVGNANYTPELFNEQLIHLRNLREFLDKQSTVKQVTVHRSDTYSIMKNIEINGRNLADIMQEAVENNNVEEVLKMFNDGGMEVHYNNFVGTSTKKLNWSDTKIQWEINVPKGSKAAYIEAMTKENIENEKEFLLQAGSTFKIKSAEFKDGVWNMKVDLVQETKVEKAEPKIKSNKVKFTNLSESDIALLQKYEIDLDGVEKPQRKFGLDEQKTAKNKIDNPSNLTNELKRHHYRQRSELKELFDKNPNLDRTVGSVPRSWGNVLQSADGVKKVDTTFSKFVNAIHSGTPSSDAIKVLEGELSSLLNTDVKVDRLGGGGFGVTYKIEADGRKFVLKIFGENIEDNSSTHGGWAELSSAVYASDKTKNVAKFYMGKFGETDMDTYMLTRYISDQDADIKGFQKSDPSGFKGHNFKMLDVISKFDITDAKGQNYIGWKIVDYGELSETTFGKMSQEGYTVLRQMCEAADKKSYSRMQQIAEQYKGSPELREAIDAYNYAIMRAGFVETSDAQTLRENIKIMECFGDDYKKPDFNYLAFYDYKSLALFYEMSEAEAKQLNEIFNNRNYNSNYGLKSIGRPLEDEIDLIPEKLESKVTKTKVEKAEPKPETKVGQPTVKTKISHEINTEQKPLQKIDIESKLGHLSNLMSVKESNSDLYNEALEWVIDIVTKDAEGNPAKIDERIRKIDDSFVSHFFSTENRDLTFLLDNYDAVKEIEENILNKFYWNTFSVLEALNKDNIQFALEASRKIESGDIDAERYLHYIQYANEPHAVKYSNEKVEISTDVLMAILSTRHYADAAKFDKEISSLFTSDVDMQEKKAYGRCLSGIIEQCPEILDMVEKTYNMTPEEYQAYVKTLPKKTTLRKFSPDLVTMEANTVVGAHQYMRDNKIGIYADNNSSVQMTTQTKTKVEQPTVKILNETDPKILRLKVLLANDPEKLDRTLKACQKDGQYIESSVNEILNFLENGVPKDDGILAFDPSGKETREDIRSNMLGNSRLGDKDLQLKQMDDVKKPQLVEGSKYYNLGTPRLNKNTGEYVFICENLKDVADMNGVRGKNPLFGNKEKGLRFRLAKLKEYGIKTIIDFRAAGECNNVALKILKELGMEYENFPVEDGNWNVSNVKEIGRYIEQVNKGDFYAGCANGQARTDLAMAINYLFNPQAKNVPEMYYGSNSSTRVSVKSNVQQIFEIIKQNPEFVTEWGWKSYDDFTETFNKRFILLTNSILHDN